MRIAISSLNGPPSNSHVRLPNKTAYIFQVAVCIFWTADMCTGMYTDVLLLR